MEGENKTTSQIAINQNYFSNYLLPKIIYFNFLNVKNIN